MEQSKAGKLTAKQAVLLATRHDVIRTYSGRPGCGCGCRGTYSDKPASATKMLNLMRERADEVRLEVMDGCTIGEDFGGILVLQDDARYRWAYLRKGVVEAMEALVEAYARAEEAEADANRNLIEQ